MTADRQASEARLAAAQTVPAAKAILASDWKQDPDHVKQDADKFPEIVRQRDCCSSEFAAVEKEEQSIAEKAKQDLAAARTVPAAKAILASDWKQDPDVVKRDADKLPATVQQLAAAEVAEKQAESISDAAKQDLAAAQTTPAAKAVLKSVWNRDPDDVKQDADKLPATAQERDWR